MYNAVIKHNGHLKKIHEMWTARVFSYISLVFYRNVIQWNLDLTDEPLFNEVLDITNDILRPGQSYSKMYGIEPRYNEFFDITNIIRKPKSQIYLDITNSNVNTPQKINAEQINSQQTLNKSFNPYGEETATFKSTVYHKS